MAGQYDEFRCQEQKDDDRDDRGEPDGQEKYTDVRERM
jgi:hypothetical protein